MLVARFMEGQYIRPYGGVGIMAQCAYPQQQALKKNKGLLMSQDVPSAFLIMAL